MATLTDKGIKDGTTIGNPSTGNFYRFMDSSNSNVLTIRDSTGADAVYGTGGGIDQLGWATITDTVYTSGSPFTLVSGVPKVLDFTVSTFNDTYCPSGYSVTDFFHSESSRVVTPAEGWAYDFRLTFKCIPSNSSRQLITAFSIGTGIGSQIIIDQRSNELRTSGSVSYISSTSLVYGLDTFLANGMQIILSADTNCNIYDIVMTINRTS